MRRSMLCLVMAFWTITSFGAAVTFNGGGDGTTWEDINNWDSGSLPTAADDVFINGTANVTLSTTATIRNLSISNSAELIVNTNANLSVANSVDIGTGSGNAIALSDDARLINDGVLDIQDVDDEGDGVNLIDDSYFENNGTVTIQNMDDDGIELDNNASVKNTGTINIDNVDSEGLQQDDDTQVVNEGTIIINDADGDGICMDDPDVRFTNAGKIEISDISDNAIEVDDGLFTNTITGTIRLFNLTSDGIDLQDDGSLENAGEIEIMISADDDDDNAIDLKESTSFTNEGTVRISITGFMDAPAIDVDETGANLSNTRCGLIDITTENSINIDNGGSVNNGGVIATAFAGINENDGTFTNEAGAVLLSPGGNFEAAPNAVINNGSIGEPCSANTMLSSLCNGGSCRIIEPLPAFSGKLLIPLALILLALCTYFLVIKLD